MRPYPKYNQGKIKRGCGSNVAHEFKPQYHFPKTITKELQVKVIAGII
jgi:hypothetical protein